MKKVFILSAVFLMNLSFAQDQFDPYETFGKFLIYSVEQELPMGVENEVLKKNYYINIGSNQGVKKGTKLDVFRIVSRETPYSNKKRINHKVKIGELKVLHTETDAAIARPIIVNNDIDTPMFEVNAFMIGDRVNIHLKN